MDLSHNSVTTVTAATFHNLMCSPGSCGCVVLVRVVVVFLSLAGYQPSVQLCHLMSIVVVTWVWIPLRKKWSSRSLDCLVLRVLVSMWRTHAYHNVT